MGPQQHAYSVLESARGQWMSKEKMQSCSLFLHMGLKLCQSK